MAYEITLVTGGIRSGKSAMAERLAIEYGSVVAYVATGSVIDAEMERRIAVHQARRPARWLTVEAGEDLPLVIDSLPPADAVLLDDLGGLITRLLLTGDDGDAINEQLEQIEASVSETLQRQNRPMVIVTSEVGLSLVPTSTLGRVFTDLLGQSNQRWADRASAVYLVIAGQSLRIK